MPEVAQLLSGKQDVTVSGLAPESVPLTAVVHSRSGHLQVQLQTCSPPHSSMLFSHIDKKWL